MAARVDDQFCSRWSSAGAPSSIHSASGSRLSSSATAWYFSDKRARSSEMRRRRAGPICSASNLPCASAQVSRGPQATLPIVAEIPRPLSQTVGASTVIDLLVLTQKFSTHVILKPWAGTRLSVMIDSRNRIGGGSSFKADHSPCRGARILPFSRSREIPARNSRASERSGPATQILLEDHQ